MSEINTLFSDAVMPKKDGSPSGSKKTGSEAGFPARTGGKLPEVIRDTTAGLPSGTKQ